MSPEQSPGAGTLDAAAQGWDAVRAFMLKSAGVVLAEDQSYLLESRLGPIARRHNFPSIAKLVAAVGAAGAASELGAAVIDAMTTHESSFFREATFWSAFERLVVPALLGRPARPLRVWSAGCSHGQEAYTVAMLLEERWPDAAGRFSIVGSDISATAVQRAREGVFSALEASRGLDAARLARHFDRVAEGFRVNKGLRDRVAWRVQNLLSPQEQVETYDVILCRNVVMYFGRHERRIVLTNLSASVRPGGFIGLGVTERWGKQQLAPGWYAVGG